LPASLAADVPVFIATPTSAWANAGGVVGAVPGHRDELAALLLGLDQHHLVLGSGLGQEVVHPGLACNGASGERVVAGDHHGSNAHPPHLVEPLPHTGLDDVFEVDHPECTRWFALSLLGDHQGGTAGGADAVHNRTYTVRRPAAVLPHPSQNRCRGTLTDAEPGAICVPVGQVDAGHPGLSAERHPVGRRQLAWLPCPEPVPLFREDDDGPPLGGLVGEAGELCGVSQLDLIGVADRDELARLPVAQRNGACLVQQQGVDVTGRLHRSARHGQHVALHQAVHAGNADGRQQGTDRGRDQANQQRYEHYPGDPVAGDH
jgi:hypothetical protein